MELTRIKVRGETTGVGERSRDWHLGGVGGLCVVWRQAGVGGGVWCGGKRAWEVVCGVVWR